MQIPKSVFCEPSSSKTVTIIMRLISSDSLTLFVYTTRCIDAGFLYLNKKENGGRVEYANSKICVLRNDMH